jgi:hypothetical protein
MKMSDKTRRKQNKQKTKHDEWHDVHDERQLKQSLHKLKSQIRSQLSFSEATCSSLASNAFLSKTLKINYKQKELE